jgi:hypothetical protein
MCDYSLMSVRSRPAKVGDQLVTHRFNTYTRGLCAPEEGSIAVCLLPGTELSFAKEVRLARKWPWSKTQTNHKTAIFRQINKDKHSTHRDALEFPDGKIVLLTLLKPGQHVTVLQLPAATAAIVPKLRNAQPTFS